MAATASTIVCCGVSFIITATSPNWRSASTRATGAFDCRARTTARLDAITDLPAPPFVEKTLMSRPSWTLPSARTGVAGTRLRVSDARSIASRSCPLSAGAATTSRTPARSACCSICVVSSSTTMIDATSGWRRVRACTSFSPFAEEYDGPITTMSGVPGSTLSSIAARVAKDAADTVSLNCIARRVRNLLLPSTTATVGSS